jgi:hypothetical protein
MLREAREGGGGGKLGKRGGWWWEAHWERERFHNFP